MARGEHRPNGAGRVDRASFGGNYSKKTMNPQDSRPMTAYEKHEKENPELMDDMDGGLDAHFPESAKLNPKGAY